MYVNMYPSLCWSIISLASYDYAKLLKQNQYNQYTKYSFNFYILIT